jgi:hypothetical protein
MDIKETGECKNKQTAQFVTTEIAEDLGLHIFHLIPWVDIIYWMQ